MKLKSLIKQTSRLAGVPELATREAVTCALAIVADALGDGETVKLPFLGRFRVDSVVCEVVSEDDRPKRIRKPRAQVRYWPSQQLADRYLARAGEVRP